MNLCPISTAQLRMEDPAECDGGELGLFNRGILTHWERQVAARELAEARSGAPEANPGDTGGDATAEVKAMVEEELGRVNYLEAYRLTPLVAGLFLFYYLLYPVVIRVFKVLQHDATGGNESSVGSRGRYELTFAGLAVLVGLTAAIESMPILLHTFHQLKDIGVVRGVVASIAGGSSVIALTLFGRLMQQFAGLTRKLVMVAVGLLGMLLPLIFVLYVAETLVWEWHALTVADPEWKVLALFVGLVVGGVLASGVAKVTGGTRLAEVANGTIRWALAAAVFFVGFASPFWALQRFSDRAGGGGHGWTVLYWILCLLLAWAGGLVFEWLTAKSERLREAKGGKIRYLLVGLFALAVLAVCLAVVPSEPPPAVPDSIYYTDMAVHAALEGDGAAAGTLRQVMAGEGQPAGVDPAWFVLVLALVIWFFSWAALDINLTSFHGVYRDRLAEAYLVGVDKDTRLDPETRLDRLSLRKIAIEDDLDMADINQRDSIAPYHLVNVAHNLQGSEDPNVRERFSDFFVFTKHFYGGHRTGYARSEELEGFFPQMDLATAMAISAAAAAPNMGATTNRMLVALMVLLNVRLGYWVPNPRRLKEWFEDRRDTHDYYCRHHPEATQTGPHPPRCRAKETVVRTVDGEEVEVEAICDRVLTPKSSLSERFRWRIPPRLIFSELASRPEETKPWVNLSDGGHIENLAVYELLRRRVKYIIVGDGGGDPEFTFGSLATLKRYARIDMGVEIDILLDDLRLDDDRYSYQHAALGTIRYPAIEGEVDEEVGYLLYIKLSVTGDEDEVVNEYRRRNESFPHQSTGDQFFDEGQFEAYRDLGFHVAEGLFQGSQSCGEFSDLVAWIHDLESNLAPRMAAENLFLDLQADLARIEDQLQHEALAGYFYELNPQLAERGVGPPPPPASDDERRETERRLVQVVGSQLRLMENVYVSLDLERARNWENGGNRTWRRLLERWAAAPSFRDTFPTAIGQHRKDFADFCRRRLIGPAGAGAGEAAAPEVRPPGPGSGDAAS